MIRFSSASHSFSFRNQSGTPNLVPEQFRNRSERFIRAPDETRTVMKAGADIIQVGTAFEKEGSVDKIKQMVKAGKGLLADNRLLSQAQYAH